jgi:hypothetical protein
VLIGEATEGQARPVARDESPGEPLSRGKRERRPGPIPGVE